MVDLSWNAPYGIRHSYYAHVAGKLPMRLHWCMVNRQSWHRRQPYTIVYLVLNLLSSGSLSCITYKPVSPLTSSALPPVSPLFAPVPLVLPAEPLFPYWSPPPDPHMVPPAASLRQCHEPYLTRVLLTHKIESTYDTKQDISESKRAPHLALIRVPQCRDERT